MIEKIKGSSFTFLSLLFFVGIFALREINGWNWLSLINSIFGIVILIRGSKLISMKNIKLLKILGNESMAIYLLHGPILIVLRTLLVKINIPFVASLIMILLGIVLSMIIAKFVLHKMKILDLVFLGIEHKSF